GGRLRPGGAAGSQLRQPRGRPVRRAAGAVHQRRDGGGPEGSGHRARAGPVMMRAQAPWIFSPRFYRRCPDRVAELIAGAEGSTQPAEAFAAQMAALNGHDCTGRIGAVRVPTLVLAASEDIIIRPELSRGLFDLLAPGSGTWAVVPGGHAAFWED